MRILVTGTRNDGDHLPGIFSKLDQHDDGSLVIVHGDCPTGVDAWFEKNCKYFGITTERHPADWAKHGRAAGPLRNQAMVDLGADLCLAFPQGESRGTRDCIRRAEAAGIPVRVVEL